MVKEKMSSAEKDEAFFEHVEMVLGMPLLPHHKDPMAKIRASVAAGQTRVELCTCPADALARNEGRHGYSCPERRRRTP